MTGAAVDRGGAVNETGRCAGCRWWEEYQPPYPAGRWARPKLDAGQRVGDCQMAEYEWNDGDDGVNDGEVRPTHRATLAWAEDASNFSARLVTVADFGCVQWEAKA